MDSPFDFAQGRLRRVCLHEFIEILGMMKRISFCLHYFDVGYWNLPSVLI